MGWEVAVLTLTLLSLLAEAIPPGPTNPEYYKDDDGSYNINYKVETDKGLISVRQHHHNLGVEKPVKELPPPPAVLEELEPSPKYVPPNPDYLPPVKDDNPPPIAPKFVPLRRKTYTAPLPLVDEPYPSRKYEPPLPPPKYVSVKSAAYTDEDEDCLPEEGPSPVPKYESVRYASDDTYEPAYGATKRRSYAPYPELLDRTYEGSKRPFKRNKILSRIVDSTGKEDLFSTPKEQKDKLYSMGLIYMKNLW